MKQLWKVRLAAILLGAIGCIPLSLEALGAADPQKLSLFGLWIGTGLITALACTLAEALSDC